MIRVIIFFCFGFSLFALKVGSVDFYSLVLLHPKMENYHFTLHSFARQKEVFAYSRDLAVKINDLFLQREAAVFAEKERLRHKLLSLEIPEGTSFEKSMTMRKEREEEQKFSQQSLEKIHEDFLSRMRGEIAFFFLDTKERNLLFREIFKEIGTEIESLRRELKLDIVIRSKKKLKIPKEISDSFSLDRIAWQIENVNQPFLAPFLEKARQNHFWSSLHGQKDQEIILRNSVDMELMKAWISQWLEDGLQSSSIPAEEKLDVKVLQRIYKKYDLTSPMIHNFLKRLEEEYF